MATVDLFPDFRQFLESLNSAGVRYLVLGGYAVVYYGYRRTTDDLDVWIAIDPDNTEKVSRVLQAFAGFLPEHVRPQMLATPNKAFIFGRKPARIDILTSPDALDFEASYCRRRIAN